MAFTPETPFPKAKGHVLKSKDWNDAIKELQRLDADKVNKSGDDVTGPLTVAGNVGIGSTAPQSRLHVRSLTAIDEGTTSAGAWANFGSNAFFDGAWKRIDSTKAGVSLHMNAADSAGEEFRFLRVEADGTNQRNIAHIGTTRSFISEGNVGIGTRTPGAKLDVSGSGGASQCCAPVAPTLSLAEASSTANRQAWLQFHNAGEAEAYIRLSGGGPAGSARAGQRRFEMGDNQGANTALQVLTNSNPLRFTAVWNASPDGVTNQAEICNDTTAHRTLMIVGNRSAGFGPGLGRRVSVWDRLEVNGDLNVTATAAKPGGGSWTVLSDRRLKKDTRSLSGALDKISQLRGVSFEWKEPEEHGNLTGPQMGLIAQEVEEVFPGWVGTDHTGYKNVTVRGFEALTVEAFKELKTANENLQARNEDLEKRITALELNESDTTNGRAAEAK